MLSVEQAEVALPVQGDQVRLIQAVTNLLHNAIKYTPHGGAIQVRTRLIDGQAEVRVGDSGIGLAPELIDRIFDLFTQGPQLPGQGKSGLGLGLTLVRRIMELHGGRAEARSDGPGTGSELILCLPRSAEAAAALAEARADARDEAASQSEAEAEAEAEPGLESNPGSAAAERAETEGGASGTGGAVHAASGPVEARSGDSTGGARRILVVDDNPDIVTSMTMALTGAGHAVEQAHSGREALAVAARFEPDTVVLDIGLPDMDGHEVARALREQPQTAEAVLIAVTGYGQASDREQAYAAGFDHHLPKPARIKDLLAVLDKRRQPGAQGGEDAAD
ncbi:hybrid sensor histidine kinase/response regulator [Halochromatium glycolicum]|uniref:hybrid sensor histidine kinase/response regulator n=1 Tax=Halochromatium glycolicum TaxID=85075 RepID=UPI0030B8199D